MPEPDDGGPGAYPSSFDPSKARDSRIPPTATVKEIYLMVMQERPDTLERGSEGWTDFGTRLYLSSLDLNRHHETLKAQWSGDAAHAFYSWIEGTKSSLVDWQYASYDNARALYRLSTRVQELKDHMNQMWKDFNHDIGVAQAKDDNIDNRSTLEDLAEPLNDLGEEMGGMTHLDPIVQNYTTRAVNEVLNPLNNAYKDAYIGVYPGSVFTGPTNALTPTNDQIAAAMGLAPGGPGRPGAPGRPGGPGGLRGTPPSPPGMAPAGLPAAPEGLNANDAARPPLPLPTGQVRPPNPPVRPSAPPRAPGARPASPPPPRGVAPVPPGRRSPGSGPAPAALGGTPPAGLDASRRPGSANAEGAGPSGASGRAGWPWHLRRDTRTTRWRRRPDTAPATRSRRAAPRSGPGPAAGPARWSRPGCATAAGSARPRRTQRQEAARPVRRGRRGPPAR